MRALGLLAIALPVAVAAGPYTEAGVAKDSALISGWATGFSNLVRGPMRIDNPGLGDASFGTGADALGPASGNSLDTVSLGDGGRITLSFAKPIFDGSGADFAVFENGLFAGQDFFGELGFVDVSSNGTDFVRFDSVSLTQTQTQVSSFGYIDPSNVRNLAGKHAAGFGTPFDLSELRGRSPLVNVDAITHVRIVDVVGSIDPRYARLDSLGNAINDPWATPFAAGGFDLDGVGAIHVVPEPASLAVLGAGAAFLARRRRR